MDYTRRLTVYRTKLTYIHFLEYMIVYAYRMKYGVATISRLLNISVSFAKEPYKRDNILQKIPIILRSLLIVATP